VLGARSAKRRDQELMAIVCDERASPVARAWTLLRPGSVVFLQTPDDVTRRTTQAWSERPFMDVLIKMTIENERALPRAAADTSLGRSAAQLHQIPQSPIASSGSFACWRKEFASCSSRPVCTRRVDPASASVEQVTVTSYIRGRSRRH
jgi:hypothetical protein